MHFARTYLFKMYATVNITVNTVFTTSIYISLLTTHFARVHPRAELTSYQLSHP